MTTRTKKRAAAKQEATDRQTRPLINQAAIDLLTSWCEGDEEDEREQRETMEYLRKALDERRPPGYKLFL